MKILDLATRLKEIYDEHGDIEVMFDDLEKSSVWGITHVSTKVAEKNEYPEDWEMPKGFKFVRLVA